MRAGGINAELLPVIGVVTPQERVAPLTLKQAQRSLRLMGKNPDNVDLGIALMHIEAASGEYKRYWEWGSGGCVAHLTIEEKS